MRFRAGLVAAAILAGACSGGSGAGSVLAVDPPNVTESYLLLQIHREYARKIGNLWGQAWGWCGGASEIDSSDWEDSKTIRVGYAAGGDSHKLTIMFSKLGYDPETSSISYGSPKTVTSETSIGGHNYIYDLTGTLEDGHFSQTDQVELSRSRSVEITHGVTFNATVESETKISGSYVGVGLEQTIKASFGYENSQEEKRAEEESTTATEAHTFDVPLPANAATRISLAAGSTTAATRVEIDGVAVWVDTVTLGAPCITPDNFAHWWNQTGRYVAAANNPDIFACWGLPPGVSSSPTSGPANTFGGAVSGDIAQWLGAAHGCTFTIPLVEVGALFSGRHSAWQGFAGWLGTLPASTVGKLADALDATWRSVSVSGIQNTEAEHDLVTKVRTISPADIPDLLEAGYVQCDPGSNSC